MAIAFLLLSLIGGSHATGVFEDWGLLGSQGSSIPFSQIYETDAIECRFVQSVNETEKCNFVTSTADCNQTLGFINYIEFVYCTFSFNLVPLSVAILIFWWTFLFLILAITADDFFCPSLVVIKDTLRLSDNIAGVTLLAFGNGAPDVFSAISAVNTSKGGDMGLAFGALLGAGVFLTTVVAGAVCCVKPFHAAERPFLRDVIFYLGTTYFTFVVIYYGTISFLQAILFLVLYAVYVIVVVVGRIIYQKRKKRPHALGDEPSPYEDSPSESQSINRSPSPQSLSSDNESSEQTPLVGSRSSTCTTFWKIVWLQLTEAFTALSPITAWRDKGCLGKIFAVFKAPGIIILRLAIPVVDEDRPMNNWSRSLNSLHCFVAPTLAVFLASTKLAFHDIGGVFPVWALVLVVGSLLSVVVFCTSSNEEPPKYHWVFAFVGFILAVIWIQAVANEIVNILRTFGVVFSISDAILGLTLLAWGNSIGDFVADIVMAKQDRARIGISACFGGPLFNTLIGVGIPFTMQCIKSESKGVMIEQTALLYVLVSGVIISLVTSLIVAPILKFRLNKYYSTILFCIYVVFLIVALLTESGIISWDFVAQQL